MDSGNREPPGQREPKPRPRDKWDDTELTRYSSLQQASPLRELTCHIGSHTDLPPGRGDIPAFTPAKLALDLATLERRNAE